MRSAVERLTRLVDAADRYDIPPVELRAAQIAAADERLKSAGAQRVVRLGSTGKNCVGSPHDAMYRPSALGALDSGRGYLTVPERGVDFP